MAEVTDPVCGMTVDTNSAAGQSTYAGEKYYFCSTDCKRQFDEQPGRFVGARSSTGESDRAAPDAR